MTIAAPLIAARLLGGPAGTPTYAAHCELHGELGIDLGERERAWLILEIEAAGLTGRGGAGFPSARKLRLIDADRNPPTLVANCMEGDPTSMKDAVLVSRSPHLVLDGVEVAAAAIKATSAVVCVPDHEDRLANTLRKALSERAVARPIGLEIEVHPISARYLVGEESALVDAIVGGRGVPTFRPDKSVPLTIGRRPAIVHNIETIAHLALIARHGAAWFRSVGAAEAPGTCLVTIGGAVARSGVVEVPTSTPIREILEMGYPFPRPQAVLVGGFGGVWIPWARADTPYSLDALRVFGAAMGVGSLVVLGAGSCGLRESARIVQYMSRESAGQCGPCFFGLPAIADDLDQIARAKSSPQTVARLIDRCAIVEGRGACGHPSAVSRLVRSAIDVFAADLELHVRGSGCPGADRPGTLTALRDGCGR